MKEMMHYNLLHHNTFGIDCFCDKFVEFSTEEEAEEIARQLKPSDKYLILGGGSDLLLTGDYHGTVVHSRPDFHPNGGGNAGACRFRDDLGRRCRTRR